MFGGSIDFEEWKLPDSAVSFRPITLTSCAGNLMEFLLHRRLMGLIEFHEALPCELPVLQKGRRTDDAISDVIIYLEAAKSAEDSLRLIPDTCCAPLFPV